MRLVVPLLVSFSAALLLVRALWSARLANLVLDIPNDRSLHNRPVPRTGGLGLMLAAAIGWTVAGVWTGTASVASTAVLALALAATFLVDDVKGLSVPVRFATQAAVAVVFVAVSGSYSAWLWPLLVIGLVWSMNLYNFMDGANGMAGSMALIGFAALAIVAASGGAFDIAALSAAVSAAALGFLVWNWTPARIFLGDAGSIPLGFLAAAIGVLGWERGVWPFWFPALVFAVFIVDSGLTLAKRIAHGEKPWQAHRSHYYQRLVRMGLSHAAMTSRAAALMLATSASAILLLRRPALIVAAGLIAWAVGMALLARLIDQRWRQSPERAAAIAERARTAQ